MDFVSLEDLIKISNIVGEHISEDVNIMLRFKKVMFDIKLCYSPSLIRSCTGFNCKCWNYGIIGRCIDYNTCLRCYKQLNSLKYCTKCDNKIT